MQILRNTPATLELRVYQVDDLIDLDANPTLAVTDANGTTVTVGAVSKPGGTTGIYQAVLPSQPNLSDLVATWTGLLDTESVEFVQRHEIVGNFLFTSAQARGWQTSGNQTPLSDTAAYLDSAIVRMRELVTDQFEEKTGRSWTTRYCRMEHHGGGTVINLLDGHPQDVYGNESGGVGRIRDVAKLISVTIDGVAGTLSDFKLHGRKVIHTAGSFPFYTNATPFPVVVEYEYGQMPTPLEANENGLRVTAANLVPSDIPSYSQNFTANDEGTITFPPGGFVWPAKTMEWLERNKRVRIPVVA